MSARNPADRRMIARTAALTRWSRTPDRGQALAPARAGLLAKLEDEVDPKRELAPHVRAKLVESARLARYARMSKKSAEVRRARKGGAA